MERTELTVQNTTTALTEISTHKCLCCGLEYEGNFCPNCGQSAKVGRLTFKRILSETLPDIYNLDNKFLRTSLDLFRRPGHMIKDYIDGNRVKYHKPISMLFVLATVYIVVANLCNIETSHPINTDYTVHVNGQDIRFIPEGSFLEKLIVIFWNLYWNKAWSTIANVTLLLIPIKFAFRKTDLGKTLNYAEYFFIMIFLMCQHMIVDTGVLLWNSIFGSELIKAHTDIFEINGSQSVICILLEVWAMTQMFKISFRKCFWLNIQARIIYTLFFLLTCITIIAILYFCGFFDIFNQIDSGTEEDFARGLQEALGN